jgi:hypothetical protein
MPEHLLDVLDRRLRSELLLGRLQQVLRRLVKRLQRLRSALQFGLLRALFPDVDDRGDKLALAVLFERPEADRHGEFGPVRA